jgi:alkylation response protein AidB-like acyl-CoA dehydrogenase
MSDVRVGRDRLLGESEEARGGGRQSARDNFVAERAGVAAMSLGIIEECLHLDRLRQASHDSGASRSPTSNSFNSNSPRWKWRASTCATWCSPHRAFATHGAVPTFRGGLGHEALRRPGGVPGGRRRHSDFRGNGYIAEYRVEQFSRDARVLRIYAGTDEMQVVAIAKDLTPVHPL